jgi:hypothetical protein
MRFERGAKTNAARGRVQTMPAHSEQFFNCNILGSQHYVIASARTGIRRSASAVIENTATLFYIERGTTRCSCARGKL